MTSLTVAAAKMDDHFGRGADDETPPAMGSSPGSIPITTADDTTPVMTAALAGGMRLEANNGHTRIWVKNGGPDERTVYVKAAARCSHGFSDDEVVVLDVGEAWISKDLPVVRFGSWVDVTYDEETGLEFGAMRQGAYVG